MHMQRMRNENIITIIIGRNHPRNEYHCRQIQNKGLITFNDSHSNNPSHNSYDNIGEDNFIDNNLTDISRSVELIKTVQPNNINYLDKDGILDGSLAPLNQNFLNSFHDKIANDGEPLDFMPKDENENRKHIDWNDMFDLELYPNDSATNNKIFEIPPSKRKLNESNKENKIKTIKRKNDKKVTDMILKKVKKAKNKIEFIKEDSHDMIVNVGNEFKMLDSKKIVSESEDASTKHKLCKQKYTKTVNNWLNNIKLSYSTEEETNIDNITFGKDNDENYISKVEPAAAKKKIVQAQLKNKDGVMKYSKPKKTNEITNNVQNKSDTKQKDMVGEKKVNKFIAPIKSGIPLKAVLYEMCTIDANNLEEYKRLLDLKDKEIFVTLIYSGGFTQLTDQHALGARAPDGLIFSYDDTFYYSKGTQRDYKTLFENIFESNKLICFNGKNVLVYLASQFQIEIKNIRHVYDTQIGGSLLEPENPPGNFIELQKLLSFTAQYTIATECNLQKAAWYITLLKECWGKLRCRLMENTLWNVFLEIETRLQPIVTSMELRGVQVDLDKLKSMEEVLLCKMRQVEQECYKAAGKVFQIHSTAQVRALLYDDLRLDAECNVKIRETACTGAKSTSESMLRALVPVHPLPRLILEYRHLHKAHATFLVGIAHHVREGVVRPSWVQMAAATGRIAANNPNLQAIPKAPFSLVLFPGPEDTVPQRLAFRSVYVARAGHALLAADFKHVECRVFAYAAADTSLLHLLSTGCDLFRALAAKWLKKEEADVSSEDRERTKRIVYAALYGAGTRTLMDILDVSYEQTLAVMASFNKTFPCLKSFGRSVVSRCASNGCRVSTVCGRSRLFGNITSEEFALRAQAERQAINFIVQGSAADLCKTAMLLTEEAVRGSAPPLRAHLLLQLHDELVWEVPREELQRAAELIKRVMEGCGRRCGVDMALPIAIAAGDTWGDMVPLAHAT